MQETGEICNYECMDPTTVPPITTPPIEPPPPVQPMAPVPPQMPVQPLMPPVTPPPSLGAQNVVSSGPDKKRLGGFGVFVILSIIILLAVWGVVGYLYLGNKNKETTDTATSETVEATPTPVPFNPDEIQIANGNVEQKTAVGESKTLVKKEDYPGSGIIGFARVSVSKDNTKLCFESIPPASDPAIYISNVDGTAVEQIVKNKHTCTWSPDSNSLLYVNDALGAKQIDIFAYSLTSKEERNLTEKTSTATAIRQYTLGAIDGNTIACSYDVVNAAGKKISSSNCSIDLVSGAVTDAAVVGTP